MFPNWKVGLLVLNYSGMKAGQEEEKTDEMDSKSNFMAGFILNSTPLHTCEVKRRVALNNASGE